MTLVDCYYCGCPVEFDPSGKLASIGITLEQCERHNLAVICNLCLDMAEMECEITKMDVKTLKQYMEKDAA